MVIPADVARLAKLNQGSARGCIGITPDETHIHQYSADGDVPGLSRSQEQREAQANCGPASASIVLRSFGIEPPTMHELREEANAPQGDQRSRAYAISPDQLVEMVESTAAEQKRTLKGTVSVLPEDPDKSWQQILQQSKRGKVVLLTGNMASNGPGHYVVIEAIGKNQLRINDPQFADGHNQIHSIEDFREAFQNRRRAGRDSQIIVFRGSGAICA